MMNWKNWIISLMMLGCAATTAAQQESAIAKNKVSARKERALQRKAKTQNSEFSLQNAEAIADSLQRCDSLQRLNSGQPNTELQPADTFSADGEQAAGQNTDTKSYSQDLYEELGIEIITWDPETETRESALASLLEKATLAKAAAAHRDSMRLLSGVMLPDCQKNSWHETDSIRNAAQLERFFDGLIALRQGKDTVLTVVQLGDSHIQAGYLPGRIMRLLHADFGNAGRGWLSPLKLSKTNEPADYFITSNISEWTAGRCIQNNKKCQIGIGGMAIQAAPTPRINLSLIITPNNGAGYGFNQAVFYRDAAAMPMKPVEQQWGLVDWQTSDSILIGGVVADTFRMQAPIDTLRLTSVRNKPGSIESAPASAFTNRYYGFNLTNGDPGILYHAVGINGAMYENYTDSLYLQQLALLSPDLLILSLGTNETFGRRFRAEEFEAQVRALLQMIRQYLPETALLLTTPPECYKRVTVDKKRTYVRNQHTQTAALVITSVADDLQLPCWDLFATGGGKGSCATWHQQGLMGRDRIHFNQNGYREQGTLFYRALMHSYNQYNTQRDVY